MSDKEADKGISGMGVGLGPREGSDGGRTGSWTGGVEEGVGLEGRTRGIGLGGSHLGNRTRGIALGGWTRGVVLGGSHWRGHTTGVCRITQL